MGTFYKGDRVRLGMMRGGIVVRHEGQLRVRFPHSGERLLWLDHCVPDEGPDGRIYPHTWDVCAFCGNPTLARSGECINCVARAEHRSIARARAEQRRDQRRSVHVADRPTREGRAVRQRCQRCAVVLVSYIGDVATSALFPEGALVRRTFDGWAETRDRFTEPTCTPIAQRRTA